MKNQLTNKQYERDKHQGKKAYRLRMIEDNEQVKDVKTYIRCSCLDSAFERQAIDSGLVSEPVFPENQLYLKNKNAKTTI
jgi:hypothetical protein